MNILRIALNDIRIVLKDRMIIFWWLALPLIFTVIFGSIMGDPTQDSTWIPVFTHDNHELAELFIDQLRTEKYWIDVKPVSDEHFIDDWARAIIIPPTFSQDILKGKRTDITITKGKGNPEKHLAAQTLLLRCLIKFNAAICAIDLIKHDWSPETKQALLEELNKPALLSVETKAHFSLRPPPTGFARSLPQYFVMFVMMMTIMYGGMTLAEERAGKRLNRLVASPVSITEIFMGKLLGRMLQPILQGGFLLLAGVLLFKIKLGDHPLALIPVILSFAFFCGAIGLVFGVFLHNEQQIMSIGIVTTMLLGALGGCWWPIEVVPQVFKTIALALPSYWALQAIHDVMSFGQSWAGVLPECAILCGFGLVCVAVSIPRFGRD
ncbi:MAG: ABC transporter permease [Phycisphaeraceae bacterium]|nr:ABC transporter permease [Phycisphaeraceae bacterium]